MVMNRSRVGTACLIGAVVGFMRLWAVLTSVTLLLLAVIMLYAGVVMLGGEEKGPGLWPLAVGFGALGAAAYFFVRVAVVLEKVHKESQGPEQKPLTSTRKRWVLFLGGFIVVCILTGILHWTAAIGVASSIR